MRFASLALEISYLASILHFGYPPDESVAETLVRGAGRPTEKGFEGMSIWKLKEGQFDKMAKCIMSAMAMFNNVEGFGWKVEIWATFEESAAIR